MKNKRDRSAYMRSYRQKNKQDDNESAKLLREIESSYRKHRRNIEAAMEQARPGTQVWLRYAEALAKLDTQRRDELVRRGFHTQNLALDTTPGFHFVAHTNARGEVRTLEIKTGQSAPKSDELPQRTPEELAQLAAWDAEFMDAPIARREKDEE